MSAGTNLRWSSYPGETGSPAVEKADGVWRVRSTEAVRQVLRERDATTQAGFHSESVQGGRLKRRPILFMDGESHRQQRSKTARYFAPKTVSTRYRELMETRADELVAAARASGEFRLDQLSLRYSVEVAAQVIGLTNSPIASMARRLERFFDQPPVDAESDGRRRRHALKALVTTNLPMGAFYLFDVRPAIRARRARPQQDVITHLIAEGYTDPEILIECVTYGAAGMVTTREFISMCTWHLLRDDALRSSYLAAPERERYLLLHEILRLEPIVGHLFRRASRDLEVVDAGIAYTIRSGELIDLLVRQANADERTVGDEPLDIRPGRDLPRGIGDEVLSFGDGPHKCPGNALAIQETDVLLQRLLSHELVIVHPPDLGWDELTAGYSLRNFVLAAS